MDLVNSDGTINTSSLKKMGKNAIDSSSLGLLLGMTGMVGGTKNTARMLVSNPIGLLLESMMGGLFNAKGKKNTNRSAANAMNDFNDVLAGFIPGLLGKTKAMNVSKTNLPGWAKDLLRTVQGVIPSAGVSRKMNVGNYEKGKVDWDGMSRKALMEVIPTQLGKILAAITGEDEQRFDYKTGKWVKATDIRSISKKRLNESSNRALGSLFADARKSVSKSKMSNADKRDYDAQVQDFINEIFLNNNEDYLRFLDQNGDFNYSKYKGVISESTLKDFRKRVQTLSRKNPKGTRNFAGNMYRERTRYGNEMNEGGHGDISESVHNRSLKFGGNAGNTLLNTVDENGYNIFNYLEQIWENSQYFVDNFTHLIPGARIANATEGGANAKSISLAPKRKPEKITRGNSPSKSAPTSYIRDIKALSDKQMDRELSSVLGDDDPDDKYKGYSKEQKSYLRKKDAAYAKGQGKNFKEDKAMEDAIADRKARLEAQANLKNKFTGKFSKLKDNKHIANLADLTGTTTDDIINLLDATSEKMTNFIYGTGSGNSKGLGEIMSESVSGIFGSFTKTVSDMIPGFIKDWGKAIADAFGLSEKWRDFKRGTGQALKNFFFGGNNQSDNVFGPEDEGYYDDVNYQEMMANGAWENPGAMGSGIRSFYRKASNAVYSAQARHLKGWNNRNYNYSNGVIAYNPAFSAGASARHERRKAVKKARKANKASSDDAAAAQSLNEQIAERVANDYSEKLGLNKKEDDKSISKTIVNLIKDMGGDTKYAMGAGAVIGGGLSLITGVGLGPIAAAAVGAGIGYISKSERAQQFLFGDFEDEVDEEGNKTGNKVRKGGKIPKKLANFLEKNAPTMVKTGTIGAAAGLVLGSPILGTIVGSAIGYVKSSEKAKNFLFGFQDKNGEWKEGLIKKKTQDFLKKKVPALSIGAIAGLLAGPFGTGATIANIIAGSAVGFVADTEKFKNWMFGEADKDGKRKFGKGGIANMIKTTLFNPIVDIFKNLSSGISQTIRDTFHNMGKGIRDFILKRLGGKLKKSKVGKALINGARAIGRGAYRLATAPVRGVSNAIRKHNIRHGKIAYQDGEVMDVNARNQYRDEHMLFQGDRVMDHFDNDILSKMVNINEDEYTSTDEAGNKTIDQKKLWAARQSRIDQLTRLQDSLSGMYDPTKVVDNQLIKERDNMRGIINDITKGKSEKEHNKITNVYNKYLKKGYISEEDYNNLFDESNSKGFGALGLDQETIDKLKAQADKMKQLSDNKDKIQNGDEQAKRTLLSNMAQENGLSEYLSPLMDKNISDTEIARMKDYIKIEQEKLKDSIDKMDKSEFDPAKETSENTSKLLEVANKSNNTFEEMLKKLEKMTKSLEEISSNSKKAANKASENNSNTPNILGGEENNYDVYDDGNDYDAQYDFMAGEGSGLRRFYRKLGIGGGSFLGALGGVAKTIGGGLLKGAKAVGGLAWKGAKAVGKAAWRGAKALGRAALNKGKNAIAGLAARFGIKLPHFKFGSAPGGEDPNAPGESSTTVDQYGNVVENKGSTAAKERAAQEQVKLEGFASMSTSAMILSTIEALMEKLVGSVPGGGAGGGSGSGGNGQDEGGLLGKLGNVLTNGKFALATGLKSFALPAAGVAALGFAVSGKGDKMWSKLGLAGKSNEEKAVGSNASYTGMTAQDASGNVKAVAMDSKGKPVMDENGNYVATDGSSLLTSTAEFTGSSATQSLSDRAKGSLARGAVLGAAKKITGNKLISTGSGGKAVKMIANQTKKAAAKTGAALKKVPGVNKLMEKAKPLIEKLFNAIKGSKLVKKFSDGLMKFKDKLLTVLMEKTGAASKEAVEQGLKSVAKIAGIVIAIAAILWDFEEGYNNASVTWGVSEPTLGQKIGAGVIHALLNFIPFVSIFIPDSLLIDLWAGFILPIIDKEAAEKLQNDREAAKLELEQYNTENGTNLTWEEYQKQVKGKYTWGEKISNGAKKLGHDYVEGLKNIGDEAKNIGSKVASGAKKAGTAIANGAKSAWNTVTGWFGGGKKDSGGYSGIADDGMYGIGGGGFIGKLAGKATSAIQNVTEAVQNGPMGVMAGILSVLNDLKTTIGNISAGVAASVAASGATDVIENSDEITATATGSPSKFITKIKSLGKKALQLANAVDASGQPKSLLGKMLNGGAALAKSLWDKISGADKQEETTSAGASGMVSQRDPRYAGMRMGSRSVGDMGCGPASAVNALNALGKHSSMSSAVSNASRYQTTGGTDLSYFRDEFGRNGVNSSYVSGSSMVNAVASGTPTVLMGRDPSNTSKSRSPFGPNNHYVVANGIDRNGNIRISDPELRSTRSYSPSILRSVNAGVAATGTRMNMRFGGRRFGFGAGDSGDRKEVIWRYLTSNGFNEYAAAGLMGCWECESGNNPRRVEADFIKKFPGYDTVMASNESLDDYTLNILFPAYGSKKINKAAYIGSDGHYYPGIGLAQWTGPRGYNILQYTRERGKGWDDLQTQLEFAIFGPGEFKSRAKGTLIDQMNQAGSIEKTTELAFTKYEGCKMSNTKGYNNRLNAAKAFYNAYSGKTYTGGIFDNVTSSNDTFKSTTTTKKSTNLFSSILEAFSNAFSRLFGRKNTTTTNTASTLSNTTSTGSDYGKAAIGDNVNNFPYYNQTESPWASHVYTSIGDNSQTVKSSGCGPTSMSMVLRSFGQNVTPASIADLSASRGHRTANSGTAWSMFKDIGALGQVNVSQFGSTAEAKENLRKGYPVIASFGPGDFTKGGHYVVLSGIDGNKFMVNDPASRKRSAQLWDTSKLSQSRQFWAFSKDGKGTLYAGDAANADHYAAGRSGLLYRGSRAGNRILLDNSGRFSAGASGTGGITSDSITSRLFTPSGSIRTSNSNSNSSGMSRETAILLKTIIQLASAIVDNTSRITDIYDVVKDICEKSGNSNLKEVANQMNKGGYVPRGSSVNQKTLDSLNDLRTMVDSVLA